MELRLLTGFKMSSFNWIQDFFFMLVSLRKLYLHSILTIFPSEMWKEAEFRGEGKSNLQGIFSQQLVVKKEFKETMPRCIHSQAAKRIFTNWTPRASQIPEP